MSSLCFVLTPLEIAPGWVAEIVPSHRLRKATAEEVKRIKAVVEKFTGPDPFAPWELYESDRAGTSQLSPDKWRYGVIEFDGTNERLGRILEPAGLLLSSSIELGFTFLKHAQGDGLAWHPSNVSAYLQVAGIDDTHSRIVITCDDVVREWQTTAILVEKNTYERSKIALQRLAQLRALPRHSDLQILALFAIIESLLTHKQANRDLHDSLTHQVRTKVPLVLKRCPRPPDHAAFFGSGIELKKLWSLLYGARSSIAHGDALNPSDMKHLKDIQHISRYLRSVAKQLIVFGIMEPEFMEDLKSV